MSKALDTASILLDDRLAFPVGSPDWEWRTRSAWKLDQMHRGIPACDWTEVPPQILAGTDRFNHQQWEAAA